MTITLAGLPPTLIARSEWGARPPRSTPTRITVPTPRLWLHHTAGALDAGGNGVWWDDVRGIQNFHLDDRGWNDIAYSFLVGGGQAFEGRGAGVAGAHTEHDNSTSHAICLIGDYTWMTPTAADLEAIAQLVAHGHRAGWWPSQITGPHSAAPGNNTSCCGKNLAARIPDINRRAAEMLADAPPQEDDMTRRIETVTIPVPDDRGRQLASRNVDGALLGDFDRAGAVSIKANDNGEPVPATVQSCSYGPHLVLSFLGIGAGPAPQGNVAVIWNETP
jgi:N-acetylmuramoyl-L-alanine amidase